MSANSKIKPLSRSENLIMQEFSDELLIYDLLENKAFCLNNASALVWKNCDGEKTVSDLSLEISRQLKTPIGEDFVWLALNELKNKNLLQNGEIIENTYQGLSRREVIRQIGLASMVVLPVISMLTVPNAAHAASLSCVGEGTLAPGTVQEGIGNFPNSANCFTAITANCCSRRASGSCNCPNLPSCNYNVTCLPPV